MSRSERKNQPKTHVPTPERGGTPPLVAILPREIPERYPVRDSGAKKKQTTDSRPLANAETSSEGFRPILRLDRFKATLGL